MSFSQITMELIKLALIFFLVVITNFLIPVLKKFIEDNNLADVYDLVDTLVRSAEQTITGSGKGKEKKDYVLKMLRILHKNEGLPVTEDEIDNIIEAAVYDMKH